MWLDTFDQLNQITQGFIIVILLFNLYFHIRFTPENALKAPAFLTTLGILSTFVGIALGLWHFDADNVQESVPELIEGIKTAVWASAFGILCALSIKLREIISRRSDATKTVGATADDIADILYSIDQSLGGEEETSLINQMKASREEQAHHMTELRQSLESFYDKMAERNVEVLVASLNEVISGFNVKLNEQFGDNFKKLNEACEKMLVWQSEYKDQIDTMIAQQQNATQAMSEIGTRYETIVGQAESFTTHAGNMQLLLEGLQTQREQMEGSLTGFARLLESASDGLPKMEHHLNEMTEQLAEANHAFNAQMGELIAKTKEQVLVLDEALSEELTKSLESFGRQMASLSEKFAEDYGPITERLQAILKVGK